MPIVTSATGSVTSVAAAIRKTVDADRQCGVLSVRESDRRMLIQRCQVRLAVAFQWSFSMNDDSGGILCQARKQLELRRRLTMALAMTATLPGLSACGGGSDVGAPTPAPTPPPPTPPAPPLAGGFDRYVSALPTSDLVRSWISTIFNFGIRRVGYPADPLTTDFAASMLASMGVQVSTQDVPLKRWDTVEGQTSVQVCVGNSCVKYAAFPTVTSRKTTTRQGALVRYQDANTAVTGKVVLLDYPMSRFAPGALQSRADWVYDRTTTSTRPYIPIRGHRPRMPARRSPASCSSSRWR